MDRRLVESQMVVKVDETQTKSKRQRGRQRSESYLGPGSGIPATALIRIAHPEFHWFRAVIAALNLTTVDCPCLVGTRIVPTSL